MKNIINHHFNSCTEDWRNLNVNHITVRVTLLCCPAQIFISNFLGSRKKKSLVTIVIEKVSPLSHFSGARRRVCFRTHHVSKKKDSRKYFQENLCTNSQKQKAFLAFAPSKEGKRKVKVQLPKAPVVEQKVEKLY